MDQFKKRIEKIYGYCKSLALNEGIPISKNIRNVTINTRTKKRLGCCKLIGKSITGKRLYEIEISYSMKEASDKMLEEIMLHELIHTCPGCMNHGTGWKAYVKRLNEKYGYGISTTVKGNRSIEGSSNIEGKRTGSSYRYAIICEGCGLTSYRKRRSKLVENVNSYRCGKCGSKLKISEFIPHLVDENLREM